MPTTYYYWRDALVTIISYKNSKRAERRGVGRERYREIHWSQRRHGVSIAAIDAWQSEMRISNVQLRKRVKRGRERERGARRPRPNAVYLLYCWVNKLAWWCIAQPMSIYWGWTHLFCSSPWTLNFQCVVNAPSPSVFGSKYIELYLGGRIMTTC